MTQDRRLEAIAGPPVVDVSAPAVMPTHSGTVIFAGLYIYNPLEQVQGQGVITPGYVRRDPPEWYNIALLATGNLGDVWWAHRTVNTGTVSVGRHPTTSTRDWLGPMRAVAYDHALTDAQAMAVVRHLAATLHAGESSLSLSLSLSHTHTHTQGV